MNIGDICGRSFQLYKQNWKQMLVLGAISAVVTIVVMILTWSMNEKESEAILKMVSFLLSPLLASGIYRYIIKLWRGEKPKLSTLFYYCRSASAYMRVLLFYLWYYAFFFTFLFLIVILAYSFLAPLLDDWATIILIVVLSWFYLRMFLAEYLFIFQDKTSGGDTVLEGFRRMKGHTIGLIVLQMLQLLLSLLYLIPMLIILPQIFGYGAEVVVIVVVFMILVVVQPLIGLMLAGFASEVLQDKQFAEEDAAVVE